MRQSGADTLPAQGIVHKLKLYKPHEMQLTMHSCPARYIVAAWGRQSGKSTAAINHILKQAWLNPSHIFWFVSPTYKQAKIIFRRMKKALRTIPKWMWKANKSELTIEFHHGAIIACQSGKEYDNLRTETLNGCVIDEVRDQHPELWPMVIRPMLSTTGGWCWFVSTPNGFDSFYDLAELAKSNKDGIWAFFTAPSTCNPKFTSFEAEQTKTQMNEAQYEQEILALFRNIHKGKAYKSEGAWNQRSDTPFWHPGSVVSPYLPVVIACDFNVNPMCWELGQTRADQWYFFDEIHLEDTNTAESSRELVARLCELRDQGNLRANPQVIVVGDATGESRNTKATESDYSIITNALKTAGISYSNATPKSNPPVKTRINSMNAKLRDAGGGVHFWYHPKRCKWLKRDFERVSWKEGAQAILDQTTDTTLTHSSDGPGYAVCALTPITDLGGAGGLTVLRR